MKTDCGANLSLSLEVPSDTDLAEGAGVNL